MRLSQSIKKGEYFIARNNPSAYGYVDGIYRANEDMTPQGVASYDQGQAILITKGGLNDLQNQNADSGWVNIPTGSAFNLYASSTVFQCRKVGKIVYVQGDLKPVNTLPGSANIVAMGTLPAGFRPPRPVHFVCQGSACYKWACSIAPDGVIGFSRYGYGETYVGCSANTWLPFALTFMIN